MLYPTREPDIIRLARDVAKGLRANAEIFPAPPFSPDVMDEAIASFDSRHESSVADQARSINSTSLKDEALDLINDITKANLRYGESLTRKEPDKLQLIAWGPKRPRSPSDLPIPGQVSTLAVLEEGSTWVSLGWKEPFDGGAVSAYKIQRRKRDVGEWIDVGTALESKATLNGQEAGVEWEYRVIALNKSGEGPVSNVARVVL